MRYLIVLLALTLTGCVFHVTSNGDMQQLVRNACSIGYVTAIKKHDIPVTEEEYNHGLAKCSQLAEDVTK